MIIDSSAFIAMVRLEPEGEDFAKRIQDAPLAAMSAATYVELSIVMTRMGIADAADEIDGIIDRMGIAVIPVTREQARLAADAFQRYGKGRHPAGLNFGDCFPYALARECGEKLLFKGGDFPLTDIKPA